MSRPAKYGDRVNTAMRLPHPLMDELRQAAADRDVSVNWLVERAIADFLARLIPADQIQLTRPAGERDR